METSNILQLAGSASANIQKVESQLFNIQKMQLHPNIDGFESPEAFGIYKGTGGKPLGVVGKQFEPMQPNDFLQSIIHTVHECGADLDLSTLKFNEFMHGEMIEFSIDLPETEFKNKAGNIDTTENKIIFTTGYNGKKSNTISLYSYRQICSNGMMGYGTDVLLKGKNTRGGKLKILNYCTEVSQLVKQSERFAEQLKALDKINVTQKQIDGFLLKLLGYNKDSVSDDRKDLKRVNILDRINQSIGLEFSRTGKTAFGLLQGITHYTNHEANGSKTLTDDEFIRFANGAKLNNAAQHLLFAELN